MRNLLPYFRGQRLKCVLAPLFKMLEATLELIVPLIVADIIDNGIASGDKNYIISRCLQLIVLGFAGLVFSVTAQYFSARAAVSFVKNLKHAIYKKIQYLSFSQFDKNGTSTLITRLTSDMDSVQNGVNLTLRLLLRSPFVVFGACIMAFRVDTHSSVSFAAAVPLMSVIIFGLMMLTIPLNKKIREALDGALLTTRESITGARVLRAFGRERDAVSEFEDKNTYLTLLQEKTGRLSALLNPLTCLTVNSAVALLIWLGAQRVNAGFITCGAVVALYNYMSQILVELIKLANLIVTLTKSIACAGRISSLLGIEDEEIPESGKTCVSDDYIVFDNVSFTYPGASEPSLENISFTVGKGERIGIIGSTGAGKTTLVNLLAGFYRPTSGDIFINGKSVSSYGREELSSIISYAEQKAVIFKGTVRSNLLFGNPQATDSELTDALKAAQAYEFVSEKPGGLDCITEQRGRNFSGGQRQRLSVARALAAKSDILILDDTSSALDYLTDLNMRRAVSELDYRAVFTVSQRTGSIMDCDRIILLENGRASAGTHSQLLESSDVYREIHYSQFEEDDPLYAKGGLPV
ncbi:MAG: ABC transporter ATP-binding protein [Clostridia bacterium]|nr:ABC transporter ATP-binding protein [Clostridia bacterium]